MPESYLGAMLLIGTQDLYREIDCNKTKSLNIFEWNRTTNIYEKKISKVKLLKNILCWYTSPVEHNQYRRLTIYGIIKTI